MNWALKRSLVKFAKIINLRTFNNGPKETLLKLQQYPHSVTIQYRCNSAKHNLFASGIKPYRVPLNKKDEIGVFGYCLLGIPITAFLLGTWQIKRRKWKLGLLEELSSKISQPPVEIPLDLEELQSMEYRPIKVRGRYLHDQEFTIGPRSLILKGAGVAEGGGGVLTPGRSTSGYCIVTPFKVEGRDLTILVNRGWVPREYRKNHRESQTQTYGVTEVTGLLRLSEKKPPLVPENVPEDGLWLYRDIDAMADYAGTAPIYIELISKETVRGGPIAGQTRIALRNEHLTYIFIWYSLALITGWLWHRQFIRKLPFP